MQYRFFIVPVKNTTEAEDELNRFLRTSRVLCVQREFVMAGGNSFWTLAVEYLQGAPATGKPPGGEAGKARIDDREVLPPEQFAVFSRLRELRKRLAEAEGVPPYTLFSKRAARRDGVSGRDDADRSGCDRGCR